MSRLGFARPVSRKQTWRGETCASCARASWLKFLARRQYCSNGPIEGRPHRCVCVRHADHYEVARRTHNSLAGKRGACSACPLRLEKSWVAVRWLQVVSVISAPRHRETNARSPETRLERWQVLLLVHAVRDDLHERRPVPFSDAQPVVHRRHLATDIRAGTTGLLTDHSTTNWNCRCWLSFPCPRNICASSDVAPREGTRVQRRRRRHRTRRDARRVSGAASRSGRTQEFSVTDSIALRTATRWLRGGCVFRRESSEAP